MRISLRIHARGNGETVLEHGTSYSLMGACYVLGLSDVGQAIDEENGIFYDDCYSEDRDNYIDIILSGDLDAARSVATEIPHLKAVSGLLATPEAPDQNLRESDIPARPR